MTTEIGEVGLRIPHDRQGTFERRLDGLAGNVISPYAKGLTTGDIQQHLLEIYGTEVSMETISKITTRSSTRSSPGKAGHWIRSTRCC